MRESNDSQRLFMPTWKLLIEIKIVEYNGFSVFSFSHILKQKYEKKKPINQRRDGPQPR
jgi:hypothetical protein